MQKDNRLDELSFLSSILFDSKLAQLKAATKDKANTEGQILMLSYSKPTKNEKDDIAEAISQISYQRWAEARRLELNRALATQTAAWLDALEQARQAFGKKETLAALTARAKAKLNVPY